MSQEDYEINERIAELIASLPREHLFQPDLMTDDQITEWHSFRRSQLILSECWRANFIIKHGDPIAESLDKKEITKHTYELIWLKVNIYKTQWELCKLAWQKYHKTFFKPDYFQSPYDLFSETLREEVEGSFSWCKESYYDLTIKKWGNALKQLSKICDVKRQDLIYPEELKAIEVQKLKNNLGASKVGFSWLGLTILLCQFAAFKDPYLKNQLIDYYDSLHKYLQLAATASRKLPGFAWKKGKKVYTSKAGGIYQELNKT